MHKIIPLALSAVVALGLLMSSLFVVDQRQFAIVYTLGEIRHVIDQPGLHFKWPPPFQNVVYYDKRILTLDTADVDRFITSEKLNLQVDTFIKWQIIEPKAFIRSVQGSQAVAADRISRSLRDALNNEIAKRKVIEIISGDRSSLMSEVRRKVDEDSRQIGVSIVDVGLKRVDFAPEVSVRVFDRMQSERKRVANERRATGAAESDKIRADAEKQREVILAEAYRDAQRIKGDGDARSASIYAEAFGRNPEFADFYRSLEAYRSTFRDRSDVMVLDPSSSFFRHLRGGPSGEARPAR
jgi:membrane protease subunit HflC